MLTRAIRRTLARLTARRRLLRDLLRRAEWADQARNTPTLQQSWLDVWAPPPAEDPQHRYGQRAS
jgi:hypothetical protein